MTQRRRSTVVLALVAMATVLVALTLPAPQAQATSYRYWTYWLGGSGDWTFSAQGAARRPPDGSVEGWRFAISQSAGSSDTPRVASTFNEICGSTPAVDGKKRVGLVLDFGVSADAPPGMTPPDGPIARCLVVPTTATGYDVMVAATSIRTDGGLVCGIAGYPRTGCGEPVSDPKPTQGPGRGDADGQSGGEGNGENSSQPNTATSGIQPDSDKPGGGGQPQQSDESTDGAKADKPKGERERPRASSPQPPSADGGGEPIDAAVALQADLPEPASSGSPMGVVAGVVVIALLVTAGIIVTRRRR